MQVYSRELVNLSFQIELSCSVHEIFPVGTCTSSCSGSKEQTVYFPSSPCIRGHGLEVCHGGVFTPPELANATNQGLLPFPQASY